MKTQTYGQYCGLARALEVVGEPWALLIVRDLIVSPKNFADMLEGFHGIQASTLSARLEELERFGVIARRAATPAGAPAVFELTDYGSELEDIVLRLGRWGAKTLGAPRRDESVTLDSMIMALRTMFRPETARGVQLTYQLNLGELVLNVRVDDGSLDVGNGPVADADLVLAAGPALKALMAGEMSPIEAIESGGVRLTGDARLLKWFVEMFHIPPPPPSHPAGNGLMPSIDSLRLARAGGERMAHQSMAGSAGPNGHGPNGRPPTMSAS